GAAARVTAAHDDGRAAHVAFVRQAEAVDMEAASLHQADETLKRAVGPVDVDVNGVAHCAPSIISALDLPGGPSGQTFSFGSIRTCIRHGPGVFSSRSRPSETSSRRSMRKASTPKARATWTKSGLSDRSISE